MAVSLRCDLCSKEVKALNEIGTLHIQYQIVGRIVHVCTKCSKKVNAKIQTLTDYYGLQMAQDIRQWLLNVAHITED